MDQLHPLGHQGQRPSENSEHLQQDDAVSMDTGRGFNTSDVRNHLQIKIFNHQIMIYAWIHIGDHLVFQYQSHLFRIII